MIDVTPNVPDFSNHLQLIETEARLVLDQRFAGSQQDESLRKLCEDFSDAVYAAGITYEAIEPTLETLRQIKDRYFCRPVELTICACLNGLNLGRVRVH